MPGPAPKYGRNLHAVNAHFRRAGAFRDKRLEELEEQAMVEAFDAMDAAAQEAADRAREALDEEAENWRWADWVWS